MNPVAENAFDIAVDRLYSSESPLGDYASPKLDDLAATLNKRHVTEIVDQCLALIDAQEPDYWYTLVSGGLELIAWRTATHPDETMEVIVPRLANPNHRIYLLRNLTSEEGGGFPEAGWHWFAHIIDLSASYTSEERITLGREIFYSRLPQTKQLLEQLLKLVPTQSEEYPKIADLLERHLEKRES